MILNVQPGLRIMSKPDSWLFFYKVFMLAFHGG